MTKEEWAEYLGAGGHPMHTCKGDPCEICLQPTVHLVPMTTEELRAWKTLERAEEKR